MDNTQPPPLEHHLIGLSTQYWTYTPLLIADLAALQLIHGVDCYVTPGSSVAISETEVSTSSNDDVFRSHDTQNNKKRRKLEPSINEKNNPIAALVNDNKDYNEVLEQQQRQQRQQRKKQDDHILPLSQCEIFGVITYLLTKGGGPNTTTNMIVDDGTGSIDCILWNNDLPIQYQLPSISSSTRKHSSQNSATSRMKKPNELEVGDTVRILGKMKCISVLNDAKDNSTTYSGQYTNRSEDEGKNSAIQEAVKNSITKIVREVHVHKIYCYQQEENHSNSIFLQETVHWLKCMQFAKRIRNNMNKSHKNEQERKEGFPLDNGSGEYLKNHEDCDGDFDDDDCGYHYQKRFSRFPVYNGAEIFKLLTPSIQSVMSSPTKLHGTNSVEDNQGNLCGEQGNKMNTIRRNDFTMKMQNYFGRHCSCTIENVPHKDKLLYCHCLATSEPLDPVFNFRNAVLKRLLEWEKIVVSNESDGCVEESEDSNNEEKVIVESESEIERRKQFGLQFPYQAVAQDKELQSIAQEIVAKKSSNISMCNSNVRRLFVNTFHSLRTDGVLSLLDVDSDVYLLLSKENVLLPSIRKLIKEEEEWYTSNNTEEDQKEGEPLPPPVLPWFLDISYSKMHILRLQAAEERQLVE